MNPLNQLSTLGANIQFGNNDHFTIWTLFNMTLPIIIMTIPAQVGSLYVCCMKEIVR